MRIGVLGSGLMGGKLGTIWARAGHEVVFSYSRSEHKLKKLARLEENIGAVSIRLTPDDLREIETAASQITIQGARYPEALEKRTGL